MASKDDISNTITAFHTHFKDEGFLVFNSDCQAHTMGEVLVDYKGLKIVKFKKSQIGEGDFDALKFNNMCHERCKGVNPAQHMKELYEELKDQFPHCHISVINGSNYQSTEQLTTYKKGDLSVYLYW